MWLLVIVYFKDPGRVWPGKRMPGRMGGKTTNTLSLKVRVICTCPWGSWCITYISITLDITNQSSIQCVILERMCTWT